MVYFISCIMSNTIVSHMLLEMAIAFTLELTNCKCRLKSLLQTYSLTSMEIKKKMESRLFYSHVYHELCVFYFFSHHFIVSKKKKIALRSIFKISKCLLMKGMAKSPEVISWAIIMRLLASLKSENDGFQRKKEDTIYKMWPLFSSSISKINF